MEDSISESNDSFVTAMETIDEGIIPSAAVLTHKFADPPSKLGILPRLPVELRRAIYELAFGNIHWVRCERPQSFYEHWAQLPGIWHREPSRFGFGPRVSHGFDADVERTIHPYWPHMGGLSRRTISVRIDAYRWTATHDPLMLCHGDVTSIEITVVPPRLEDPAQLMWIRRNALEFMRHWNASRVVVKEWTITFLDDGQEPIWILKNATWFGFKKQFTYRFDKLSSSVGKVLEVLHPEKEMHGTNKIVEVPKYCQLDWVTVEGISLFIKKNVAYPKWSLSYAYSERLFEIEACGDPGPTGKVLRKDRLEHIRVYEERASDLEFEWERCVYDHYNFKELLPLIPPRGVEWPLRHDILDLAGWSKSKLMKRAVANVYSRRAYMDVPGIVLRLEKPTEERRIAWLASLRLQLMKDMNQEELEEVKKQYACEAAEEELT